MENKKGTIVAVILVLILIIVGIVVSRKDQYSNNTEIQSQGDEEVENSDVEQIFPSK